MNCSRLAKETLMTSNKAKKCIVCGEPVELRLDDRYCPACEKLYYDATIDASDAQQELH